MWNRRYTTFQYNLLFPQYFHNTIVLFYICIYVCTYIVMLSGIIKPQCQLCIPLHILDTAKTVIIKFSIYVYV